MRKTLRFVVFTTYKKSNLFVNDFVEYFLIHTCYTLKVVDNTWGQRKRSRFYIYITIRFNIITFL